MPLFKRFALYFAPDAGPLADFGAAWLGWDPVTGKSCPHPDLPGLPRPVDLLADTPRKYGLHATLKPPFALAEGRDIAGLRAAVEVLAASLPPVTLDGLQLSQIGGFLALTPLGNTDALSALAATLVADLDSFRAPLTEADRARRHPERLSPAQRAHLDRWGYPYVMEEFQFHITLTGTLPETEAAATAAALAPVLAPLLPAPFHITQIALFGEAEDGRFHLLHRAKLTG
jgi:putative phosphonate metabolism protein